MEMESTKDKLNSQIEVDKEVLSILPKNNKKNLTVYKDKCAEIKNTYTNYQTKIISEIKRRYLKLKSVEEDPKIAKLTSKIANIEKINLINSNITSFEKMGLEELLYVLRRFYKNNLQSVDESIMECIKKFREVGINLTAEDFNYSFYAKEYISALLNAETAGNINSTETKDTFEKIYWKCPDIILHIELNFRSLYLKYEKEIDKYFMNREREILRSLYFNNQKEANEQYSSLKAQLLESKERDTALILEKFLNNEYTIRDYENANIENVAKKLFNQSEESNISLSDNNVMQEFNSNIYRLQSNLYEYKQFLTFKFIYDKALQIYNSNEKYNSIYNQKLKNIRKLEKKLFNINRKIDKKEKHLSLILKIFKSKNKLEKNNEDFEVKIKDLKQEYRELEKNKVNSIIKRVLNNNSTMYDLLKLTTYFFSFLVDLVIDEFEDATQDVIYDKIAEFREFIKYPNITIINNISIAQEKDIALTIKDKYKLCNLNVMKEDFEDDNIDKLISNVNVICTYNNIKRSDLSVEDIKFILQAGKLLESI